MEGSIFLLLPCQKDLDIKVTCDVYPVAEYQRSSLAPSPVKVAMGFLCYAIVHLEVWPFRTFIFFCLSLRIMM